MISPVASIKSAIIGIADLLFPPSCAICGRRTDGSPVCEGCAELFEKDLQARCPVCGADVSMEEGCPVHAPKPYLFYIPVFHFGDGVRELIHLLKYSSRRDIGHYLGGAMVENRVVLAALEGVDALLPVPLHHVRRRDRGYNQSEVVAERISSETGIPIERRALVRLRNTKSQTKLGAADRAKNIAGAFRARKDLSGKKFAIIDDVITTGATTRELAAAVEKAGGEVRCAISIASPGIDQSKDNKI